MISVCMICSKEEPFIDLAIASAIDWCGEIIIVGDPDENTRKRIFRHPYAFAKVKLVWRDWDGNYGAARQEAIDNANGDWILQLDCDEIIGDTAYLLDGYMVLNNKADVYDMKYRHFIRDFGHEDASLPEHLGINRFFKNDGVNYNRTIHEFAESEQWKSKSAITDIVIWHLGYIKPVTEVYYKYVMNKANPARIHDDAFLDIWKNAHLLGEFPTRKVNRDELPRILRERFEIWTQKNSGNTPRNGRHQAGYVAPGF